MNYLDLFHGIGGFALGAYWAGMKFEHHYCSDIEPWCQELYAKRFPDSVQLGDITKIDASKLPAGEWIITGGFPCQDISISGKGAGIHGERSGLWFEYWRIINDLRPRFAIMENVGMLVHRGLREVLGSLAEIGYDAEWQDIRASDVGAPHRRERIWIVAYPSGVRRDMWRPEGERVQRGNTACNEVNSGREEIPNPSLQLSHGSGQARRRRGEFTDGSEVADAYRKRLEGYWPEQRLRKVEQKRKTCRSCIMADSDNASGSRRWPNSGVGVFKEVKGEVNQGTREGVSQWWSTEPDVGMLVNGISVKLVGGLNYAGMESQKSGTESAPENGEMRVVRSNGEITETPSGHKKGNRNNNTVPDMSCKSGQIARDEKIKTDAEMCGVRKDIQSSRQPHSQNLQLRLSENPRERKRIEAVEWECEPAEIGRLATGVKNRVDRLRGLGNAIVPQIAELLFRQLKPHITDL